MINVFNFPRHHRSVRVKFFGIIALLIGAGLSGATHANPLRFQFNHEDFVQRIQRDFRLSLPTVILPDSGRIRMANGVVLRSADVVASRRFWRTCGGEFASRIDLEPRLTQLPDDLTLILAAGYLHCRHIAVSRLETRVRVASYPEGYFGDFVYEQTLIADRLEFSDEASIRQIFRMIVECAIVGPEPWPFWFDEPTPNQTAADFRQQTGFVPELMIDMVGDTPVQIEINFSNEQILIRSGDRWENYALDGRGGVMLENFVQLARVRAGDMREWNPRVHAGGVE